MALEDYQYHGAQTDSFIPSEVDVVFCGGGTTASIIAGRLASSDPSLRIAILEMGPSTFDVDKHTQPALYPTHLQPGSGTTRALVTQPSPALNNRRVEVLVGHCLGGGSSINYLVTCYTQGASSDYDDWESIYGNKGWSSKDLIPMIQRAETYEASPNPINHGTDGPLKISKGRVVMTAGCEFLDLVPALYPHVERVDDANNFLRSNVCSQWNKYIDKTTGKRSDVPHCYLYKQLQNPNLFIATEMLVSRILFEGNKAVAVEYQNRCPLEGALLKMVKARKLVVVAAGAFGSPAILERSGIGQERLLRRLGIDPIVTLEGVGENYRDHSLVSAHFYSSPASITLDAIHRGDETAIREATEEWKESGGGLLATNGEDGGAKFRFTEEDLAELGPACRRWWNSSMASAEDKTDVLMLALASKVFGDSSESLSKHFSLHSALMHPKSVGNVHCTSSTDVLADPDFDGDYLTHEEDVAMLVWAYKRMREIARRMPSYRGEVTSMHPKFPAGSAAATNEDSLPVPTSTSNLTWTSEDDKAIEDFIRNTVNSMYHSLGTCGMKARELGGVVDDKLNVYGTTGLKVADLSICPANVGANTYSVAVAIGERAAVIIAEELGLS